MDKIKVLHINRAKIEGRFSLENVFSDIKCALKTTLNVDSFFLNLNKSFLQNIFDLIKYDADIFHITGDVLYLALFLPRKKVVITVPDIGHYIHTLKGIKRCIYKFFWFTLPFKKAEIIVAISKETKKNILKYFPSCAKKVIVINVCYSRFFKYSPKKFNSICPRVLQVGTSKYKNVPAVIEALKDIKCKLILIGRLDASIIKKLDETGIQYENYVNLSREELIKQYMYCDIVSFVSLGEGFGMPIIEANAFGRALITSNILPMSDIAGDGACLVNPSNIEEAREGFMKIIQDDAYREKLVVNGIKNCQKFSATQIAEEYRNIYEKLYKANSAKR